MSSPTVVNSYLAPISNSPFLKGFAVLFMGLSIVNRTYWYTNLVRTDERIKEIRENRNFSKVGFKDKTSIVMRTIGRRAVISSLHHPVLTSALIAVAIACQPKGKELVNAPSLKSKNF